MVKSTILVADLKKHFIVAISGILTLVIIVSVWMKSIIIYVLIIILIIIIIFL